MSYNQEYYEEGKSCLVFFPAFEAGRSASLSFSITQHEHIFLRLTNVVSFFNSKHYKRHRRHAPSLTNDVIQFSFVIGHA